MYKLLLVSDRQEVLDAFDSIRNWEMLGFKAPHIRHDFEGAKESLSKHHADGIAMAIAPEEEEKLIRYLDEAYPMVSIFSAADNTNDVMRYLNELGILLNRTHADFSNDSIGEGEMLQYCRHEFFRKLMDGQIRTEAEMKRNLRLLRSRMDPDKPCIIVTLDQPQGTDLLNGRWHYGPERLEVALRNFFGRELEGWRILPSVLAGDRIMMLCCPLMNKENIPEGDSMTALVTTHTAESIAHVKEYLGLELKISGIQVLPELADLCKEH